jgi:hypothetical protein
LLNIILKIIINFHNARLIPASITIIRRRK